MKRLEITKEWLLERGITNVTEDGDVTYNGKVLKHWVVKATRKYTKGKQYPTIMIFDPDVYEAQKKKKGTSVGCAGQRILLLSRVVWAWFNGVCPSELDVDHKDNNPFNNHFSYNPEESNLQLLTRKENMAKKPRKNNQYTYMLTDDEYKVYVQSRDNYKEEITKSRNIYKDLKETLSKLQKDYDDYLESCKTNRYAKLLEPDIGTKYKLKIKYGQELVKEARDEWAEKVQHYKEFMKSHKEFIKGRK